MNYSSFLRFYDKIFLMDIKYPLVKIEWKDACLHDYWTKVEELEDKKSHLTDVITVGYLLKDDEHEKIVSQSVADPEEDTMVSASMCIPTSCVRDIIILEEGKSLKSPIKTEKLTLNNSGE